MRHPILLIACIAGVALVAGCGDKSGDTTVTRAFQDVNVIDESNLNDVMLTVADPNEAVNYFARTTKEHPERIELQRGLGQSLVRAKRSKEAAAVWGDVVKLEDSTDNDKVDYADALIRAGDWAKAEKTLNSIPPTHETYNRYRLEAIVADSKKQWDKADSFYEIAIGLTTTPGSVMNNWGYSKLSRGDYKDAERLFGEAIQHDPTLFTAKNNLVLARGAQREYSLPPIEMDQGERAQLLHTLALSAIKKGDVETGKSLLRDAISTHPQHFEAAVRSLRALEDAG